MIGFLDPKYADIASPQVPVDREIKIANARVCPSIRGLVRVNQICFGRSGGFWPINFPLFQGSVAKRERDFGGHNRLRSRPHHLSSESQIDRLRHLHEKGAIAP